MRRSRSIAGSAIFFAAAPGVVAGVVPYALTVLALRLYEEPAPARRYGAGYERYRRTVPGWMPRFPQGSG